MKLDYAQIWTVYEQSATQKIVGFFQKKAVFSFLLGYFFTLFALDKKRHYFFISPFVYIFLLSNFCKFFAKNGLFATRPPLLNRW